MCQGRVPVVRNSYQLGKSRQFHKNPVLAHNKPKRASYIMSPSERLTLHISISNSLGNSISKENYLTSFKIAFSENYLLIYAKSVAPYVRTATQPSDGFYFNDGVL